MTPREIVLRALEFDAPARVPRDLWSLAWASARYPNELAALRRDFPNDIATAPGFRTEPLPATGDMHGGGTYVDDWGCTFTGIEPGYIGEVKEPLVAAWSDLAKVRPPVERLSIDVDRINAWCAEQNTFTKADCCARPFEQIQFMRTSEQVYLDLATRPAEFFDLLRVLHEFYLKELEAWARTDVDAIMFMDDWGAQKSLLISPAQWREVFRPMYADYIDLAHAHGKKAFMHSDGHILAIIPDLIELGLDALNSQIFCMGVEHLAPFAGRITFWGEIDRQHLLPYATPEQIADAVRTVRDTLWRDGGCIAQCEFGPGARPENVRAVFQTWAGIVG